MNVQSFSQYKDFIKFEEPIQFLGFEAVGYFPYEKAQLHHDCVCSSRNVFSNIETILQRTNYMDNKIVVIFHDLTRFNTDDFAIQFKDAYCKIGRLDQVMGYACRTLK